MLIQLYLELSKEITSQFEYLIFGSRLFNWKFILSSALVALIVYLVRLKSVNRVSSRFFKFISTQRFKSELSKDIKFFFLRMLYKPLMVVFIGVNIYHLKKDILTHFNQLHFEFYTILYFNSFWGPIFKVTVGLLVYDFIFYVLHRIEHQTEWLWIFHKIHHRATSINPLTKTRDHPFLFIFNYILIAIIGTPIYFVLISHFNVTNDKPLYIYALVILLINKALIHLQHTHLKVHYGILSYLLISPVMHQVHHSMLKPHLNKNYGAIFALWDFLFGSIYIPKKNEVFKFGITEDRNKIPSIYEELVLLPIKDFKNLKFK